MQPIGKASIGAHLPIGKGLKKTADMGGELGIEALQVFLRNPRGGGAREFSPEELEYFRTHLEEQGVFPIVVHIPYICNPASVKEDVYQYALETVQHDLQRCDLVGAHYLVLHPGSYTGSTLEEGIKRVSTLLNRVLEHYRGSTMILLETMSGQGKEVGRNFQELQDIIDGVEQGERVGICYDTCHTFAAGYDCRSLSSLDGVAAELEKSVGQEKVRVLHVNDSKYDLGAGRDRHAHIGEGFIGMQGFAALLQHRLFGELPWILETPTERIGEDIERLKQLRNTIN